MEDMSKDFILPDCRHLIWDADMTIQEVADRCGQDYSFILRVLNGQHTRTLKQCHKIEAASNGAVTAAQLLGFAPVPVPKCVA